MLLLTPSRGLGGGIERVGELVEDCWPGPLRRVDLHDAARDGRVQAGAPAKAIFTLRACAAAASTRPGVVLSLHLGLLPAAAAAAAVGRSRLAVMGMGREAWSPMSRVDRGLLRRSAAVLAISPFTADWLAHRAGLARDDVRVVLLPVGPRFADIARAGRRTAPAEAGPLRLLTVSRITRECRYKGHYAVADGVAGLLAEGRAVHWTVVGDGDDLGELRAHCARLGLGEHAECRGRIDDDALLRAYAAADVLVLPSTADPHAVPPVGEGFGLVYAEAAAFGVPSVAARAGGGSSAFVVDGETGSTVPTEVPGALAAALARLQDAPAERLRLGDWARERVLRHHLPEHFRAALSEALTGG